MGDESSRLVGGLFKKCTDISDPDILESEYISYIWENYLTLELKGYCILPCDCALSQCSQDSTRFSSSLGISMLCFSSSWDMMSILLLKHILLGLKPLIQ